jgi:hypothetical protein
MTGDSFKFQKRCQFFLRSHNETPSIVALPVNNPDYRSFVSRGRRPRFPQRSEKRALRLVTQLLVLRVFGSGQTWTAIPELFAAAQRRYAARASL